MSAVRDDSSAAAGAPGRPAQVALLGTGNVGSAVLARLQGWSGTPLGAALALVYVANSRVAVSDGRGLLLRAVDNGAAEPGPGLPVDTALRGAIPPALRASPALSDRVPDVRKSRLDDVLHGFSPGAPRIIVDATASEQVARRHAHWLASGVHVVTACKLGGGTGLHRWREIDGASRNGGTRYGDAATVGAGLPLLRCIRELRAGGDRIHAIEGVLSGSLAWLFKHYDGSRPFSRLVAAARAAGYAEPDPREDLSGEDVRRKLLIIARAAGFELEADEVDVESLVPAGLACLPLDEVDAGLALLDAALAPRLEAATRAGRVLRYVARLDARSPSPARVGLAWLVPDHPLAGGSGTDNLVAIWSDRYPTQPLLIQGPGAGADVTAAGLLDDVLRIVAPRHPPA
ncbi:MAG: homoserine dehydrogenase [Pseudomonadota bacterium]|nr:homoserine dehydrogenase [Pseudomonadota bacterium]